MRKQLFDHIKSLLPEEVQHVDLWNEQLRYIQSETPFSMPAVFVEFASIPWTRLANSVRDG